MDLLLIVVDFFAGNIYYHDLQMFNLIQIHLDSGHHWWMKKISILSAQRLICICFKGKNQTAAEQSLQWTEN